MAFKKNPVSCSSLAKQIRDANRLLRLDTLAADVRVELERKCKTLSQKLEESRLQIKKANIEKKYKEKYRMIRFFEKKKALKILQKLTKQNATPEAIEEAKLNLNYVIHFPTHLKYIALFPRSQTEDGPKTVRKKNKVMQSIKADIEAGTLPDSAAELLSSCLSKPTQDIN